MVIVRADVGGRITGGQEAALVKWLQRGGQIVPELLEQTGEVRIVEHEAGDVLDHPKALAGTIGRGVHHAEGVGGGLGCQQQVQSFVGFQGSRFNSGGRFDHRCQGLRLQVVLGQHTPDCLVGLGQSPQQVLGSHLGDPAGQPGQADRLLEHQVQARGGRAAIFVGSGQTF